MADESLPGPLMRPSPEARSSSSLTSPISEFTTEALHKVVGNVYNDLFCFMQVSRIQKQVKDLDGQVTMLRSVSEDLLGEAASPGRSSILGLSTAGQFHWDQLWHSVNVVGDRCLNDTLSPLQDRLKGVLAGCAGSPEYGVKLRIPGDELGWYGDLFKALNYQAKTLEVLLAAIRLARHSNKVDAEGGLSRDTRENVSILQSLTSVLRQRLQDPSG